MWLLMELLQTRGPGRGPFRAFLKSPPAHFLECQYYRLHDKTPTWHPLARKRAGDPSLPQETGTAQELKSTVWTLLSLSCAHPFPLSMPVEERREFLQVALSAGRRFLLL